jgi:hypothetical protein
MKIKFILPIAALSLFAISCSSEDNQETAENEEVAITEVVEEISEDPLEGLILNEGAKWKVDSTTNAGMLVVDSLINNFQEEDYVALGSDIKAELGSIIDQCKMEGEDHNQYHIVLHAMMKESKALKSGDSETTEQFEMFSKAYFEHFEL